MPKSPAKRRAWIKYQLELRGSSLSDIARQEGVTRGAVSLALASPSPRMALALARAIDRTPEEIWPERYADQAGAMPVTMTSPPNLPNESHVCNV